jgi:hypothetical protein
MGAISLLREKLLHRFSRINLVHGVIWLRVNGKKQNELYFIILPDEGTQPASEMLLFIRDQYISSDRISINVIYTNMICFHHRQLIFRVGSYLHTLQLFRPDGQSPGFTATQSRSPFLYISCAVLHTTSVMQYCSGRTAKRTSGPKYKQKFRKPALILLTELAYIGPFL